MTTSDSIATRRGCDWSRSEWAFAGCAIDWRVSPRSHSHRRPPAHKLSKRSPRHAGLSGCPSSHQAWKLAVLFPATRAAPSLEFALRNVTKKGDAR